MSLSSLIVQREVASMRQVEDALAHQVIYGGDLVTNLLEVASLDEAVLTSLLAEAMRLEAAPPGDLPRSADAVRALVPLNMATEWSVVPLEVQGGRLLLAVTEPLSPEQEAQLGLVLAMRVEQRAALAVRVRQAIAATYGVPLDRRMDKLVMRLSGAGTRPGLAPPSLGPGPAPSTLRQGSGTPPFGTAAQPMAQKSVPPSSPHRVTSGGFPGVLSPPSREGAPSTLPFPGGEPRVGLLQRQVSPAVRAVHRRRGPITVEAASQAAEDATDRDALLELFFDFSRQFFEYSAMFLVHGDIAEGKDAFGVGAAPAKVLGIGVLLDMPSMLSRARE